MRVLLVAFLAALAVPTALAPAQDPPPRLLFFGGPTGIACCRSAPTGPDGFSYRARGADRVTIAIEKRRCGTCRWREVGRYTRRPPQAGLMPPRLYRRLKIGSYRAWARAEAGDERSRKRYHRFRIVPLDD